VDDRARLIDALADLGRAQITGGAAAGLVSSLGGPWLDARAEALERPLEPPERAARVTELQGLVDTLRGLASGGSVDRLLGRAVGIIARSDMAAGEGGAILRRLLPEALADEIRGAPRRVLVLNPGSTSTKLAVFDGLERAHEAEVHLSPDAVDGVEARAASVAADLERAGVALDTLDAIACRCGFVRPVPTGTYRVVPEMSADLEAPRIRHASNLAIPIGLRLAERAGRARDILLTTSDPVVSDEVELVARVTGFVKIKRDGTGAHYLNHKGVWRLTASILGEEPERLSMVTAHLGGGVSVARHHGGRVTALVDAFSGVPSANRCGGLDLPRLLAALKDDEVTFKELEAVVFSRGGLLSLAGTNDFRALTSFRRHGATEAQRRKIDLVLDHYARRIGASILALAADGRPVRVVVLTGGLSRSDELMRRVTRDLGDRFPVVTIPGAVEHEALAAGALRGLLEPESLADYVSARDALRARRHAEDRLIDQPVFDRQVLYKKASAPIRDLDQLIDAAYVASEGDAPPRMAIIGADNDEVILAARRANAEGRFRLARFSLVGDMAAINRVAFEHDLVIDGENYEIIDSDDPVADALRLLDEGRVQLLMKGSLKTEQILRGVLKHFSATGRMTRGDLVSHVLVADIPVRSKLLLMSDAAVNPYPDVDKRARITETALRVARALRIARPHVAVLSATEAVNRSVDSSVDAQTLAARFEGRADCVVEGPLSFDVAMDPASAVEKGYAGEIRGSADVLIVPNIDAGNILYKTLTTQSHATAAGVILFGDQPMALTSRGDSARSKLASIALAVKLYADLRGAAADARPRRTEGEP
jgi:butyrate kinase